MSTSRVLAFSNLPRGLQPIDIAELPVHQNHIELLALDFFERTPTRSSDDSPIAQLLKLGDGEHLVDRVVLHDKHETLFVFIYRPTRVTVHVGETTRRGRVVVDEPKTSTSWCSVMELVDPRTGMFRLQRALWLYGDPALRNYCQAPHR